MKSGRQRTNQWKKRTQSTPLKSSKRACIFRLQLRTTSVKETLAFGELLGKSAPPNTCVALHGNLGAGKTHLTRGIAVGAGVEDPSLVSSPTYVLLNIYRESANAGAKPVFHMEAYRITSEEDFEVVGFDELLAAGGIVVV